MFYKSTNCTLSGVIAGVKLYPPIYMMMTTLNLNQQGNDEQLINFKKIQIQIPSAGWRDFLAAFPSGSVQKVGLFGIWRMLT